MTEYATGHSSVITWWPGDPEGTTRVHVTNHAVRADHSDGSRSACGAIALEGLDWAQPWDPEHEEACPSCIERLRPASSGASS